MLDIIGMIKAKSDKKRKELGARPLTKEEWFDDWMYQNNEARLHKNIQFRFGHFCWKLSRRLRQYGWKTMKKVERRFYSGVSDREI